uniref:Cytochrome c biogenesis FC n=1 Tax=Taxus cuspidata TaxID=99806 RepID=A0A6M4RJP5_TAXCU|nr:cytochrome c biogenesis FC [Taxus cuspidata]
MVQLQNFFFFIIFMVVLCGTAAPVLLKWFVGRDVSIGVPSSSGTIIPIFTSLLPPLVYLHSRGFRSMDGRVLVGASRLLPLFPSSPLLLPTNQTDLNRSRSQTRALSIVLYGASFCSVLLLHFLLLGFMGDLSYSESFCGVLCLLFSCTLLLPYSNGRLAIGPHHQLYRVGVVDRYRKAPMDMNLSHGGVCIFIIGVILSSTRKTQFTQRLPLGSELHMGKERCCLRGLDSLHGPTFHSICGNLMIYKPKLGLLSRLYMNGHDESLRAMIDMLSKPDSGSFYAMRLWWAYPYIGNRGHKSFWLTMFPEKRYFFSIRETTSTTKVAIHTNPLTDPYAPIGTGGFETGGWYTTMMKLPFIPRIRIGFLLAPPGGLRSLLRQLQKDKLHRNRIPVHNRINQIINPQPPYL